MTGANRIRSSKNGRGKSRADRNGDWIEKHCKIPEGKDVGKSVVLRPWQRDQLRLIYDNPAGTRRAIISMGRKNAKTSLVAFLLLLHLCGPEAKANSELYSTAQSRDQAAKVFDLASKIVRQSPTLIEFVQIRETVKELLCPELGTRYKALSAEASTAFGLSPCFVCHDELGQVRGPRSALYDAMETAVGAHEQPLSIIISTQAATDADLLSVLIDDAKAGHDPRVVLSLFTADKEADPFAEATIRQANPAFGDFLNAVEVLAMAEDARRMPARQSEYENLILNRRVEANSPFVAPAIWASCSGEVIESFAGLPVYAGLDLSETTDLTALVLIAEVDGVRHVRPTFWLPAEGLRGRSLKDRVPYDLLATQGFLEAVPGKVIEYEYVARHMRDLFDELDIRAVAFDRWGWKHLKPWLRKVGFSDSELSLFSEFGQGMASMSQALRVLEEVILNGKLAHAGHPVLSICAANAVVKKDPQGNRKFDRMRSYGRIDGMVALAMAVAVSEQTAPVDISTMIAGTLMWS
jgi:phage terminase large subunit-like protein